MNDDSRSGQPNGPSDDGDDHPLEELQTLLEPVSVGFLGRLRRRINRRLLAGQVVQLTWYAPVAVFLEFVGMLMGLIGSATPSEREARGRD